MLSALTRRRPLIALTCIAGCRSLVDPRLPPNAQLMAAPAVYSTWWAMTEACSGRSGALASVRWYIVTGAATVPLAASDNIFGYWSKASNSIVLAGQSEFDGPSVRHEMLHALLQDGHHVRSAFVVGCGGTVDCGDQCIAEGGAPSLVDSSTVTIPPGGLQVGVDVTPSVPSESSNDGFFAVMVSATNPSDMPVRVALPDSSAGSLGTTFSYLIQGPFGGRSGQIRAKDISALIFAPHERKLQVFDFRVRKDSGQGSLPPGPYHVFGRFGPPSLPWTQTSVTLQP